MRTILVICASAGVLAGCAQRGPEIAVAGGPLPAAKTYLITQDRPATGAEPAVAQALEHAGLRPAAPEQAPDLLVQVSYAERPARMGAYVPGATPAAAPAAWLETGVKPSPFNIFRKGSRSLGVEVIDNSTGAIVRNVKAREYYRKAKPEAASRLGAAAAGALTTP